MIRMLREIFFVVVIVISFILGVNYGQTMKLKEEFADFTSKADLFFIMGQIEALNKKDDVKEFLKTNNSINNLEREVKEDEIIIPDNLK